MNLRNSRGKLRILKLEEALEKENRYRREDKTCWIVRRSAIQKASLVLEDGSKFAAMNFNSRRGKFFQYLQIGYKNSN